MKKSIIKIVIASFVLGSLAACKGKEKVESDKEKNKRVMKEEYDKRQKVVDEMIKKEEADSKKILNEN